MFIVSFVASGQETREEEMKIARAIANKLNSLTKQKPAPSQAMGAAGGTGLKSSAVSTGPQYIDLMLIVDSSGSIGTRPFEDIKDATEVFIYLSIYFLIFHQHAWMLFLDTEGAYK